MNGTSAGLLLHSPSTGLPGTPPLIWSRNWFAEMFGVPAHEIPGTLPIDVVFPVPNATGDGCARYQLCAVLSPCMKFVRYTAFFAAPCAEGCVPSELKSPGQTHVSPSLRGTSPSAHMYGPQASHGDTTAPRFGSKFSAGLPLIWSSISHLFAKPCWYAHGSGLSVVVA